MRTIVFVAALALAISPSFAADAPKPNIHPILDDTYSADASKHAVIATVDWPVGADTGWHTHPGDEYATVLEGEVTLITKVNGTQSLHVYKAGEAYHNMKGVVHDARNAGNKPAKTVVVMIFDKDQPLSQPVK